MTDHFLNADLEIYSDRSLQRLTDEIGDQAFLMAGGPVIDDLPFVARYEIDHGERSISPEVLILQFCKLIENLSPGARVVWDQASKRVIDLGYESPVTHHPAEDSLSPETLARMSNLGIALAWTFYPLREQEEEEE